MTESAFQRRIRLRQKYKLNERWRCGAPQGVSCPDDYLGRRYPGKKCLANQCGWRRRAYGAEY